MENHPQEQEERAIIKIEKYSVRYQKSERKAVDEICLEVRKGEIFGIIGESGCGKTTLGRSIAGLINPKMVEVSGKIYFEDLDVFQSKFKQLQKIRGKGIFLIFQDPNTHLNPVLKIQEQLKEVMPQKWVEDEEFKNRIIKNLQYLGITHPERVLKNYPHQLSGGEKQRILITMSLLCRPRLLIADEPTSSLDANNKILILNELYRLNQERQVTLLIITHDLAILSDMVGRIMVMYGGRMVELGKAIEIYTNPKHPYTQLLVDLMKGDFSSVEKTNWRTKEDNLCPFLPRCRYHKVICTKENPPLINISVSHLLSCWLEID